MKLSLVTCNIRFDNPADGDNSWSHRRDFLVQTLLKYSPDIIATQEGRFGQLMNMSEALSEYELIDSHRSWIKERMYPSFFIKKNQFEIFKSEDLWLSETPGVAGSLSFDSAFPRLMTWVRVQPRNSKKNFLFVNTHLDHIKKETRLCQVNVLSREIKRLWNKTDSLIIMGDFNDSPESDVRKHLQNEFSGIQDAWKLFHSKEETSHHAFQGEMQNGARIDWILVDERLHVESCELDKSQKNGKFPTDHFPVACSVKT